MTVDPGSPCAPVAGLLPCLCGCHPAAADLIPVTVAFVSFVLILLLFCGLVLTVHWFLNCR